MPKEVDHPARRRELADAACRVIARNGLGGTTLAHVADEAGWSIGSIRHNFADKDELVASALWRVGERVDDRIRRRTGDGMAMSDLRIAATELLLDGLRVQLVTTPRQTSAEWAPSVLDDFLAALAIPSAETAVPAAVDSRQG